jgi:hypothetical protein
MSKFPSETDDTEAPEEPPKTVKRGMRAAARVSNPNGSVIVDESVYDADDTEFAAGVVSAHSKVGFAPHKTASIPRVVQLDIIAALDAITSSEASAIHYKVPRTRRQWLGHGFGFALLVIGLVCTVANLRSTPSSPPMDVVPPVENPAPIAQQSGAGQPLTVIASEPSGAKLFKDGVLLGNTPLEVHRPVNGAHDYLLVLPGFSPQLVRVSAASSSAIRVTMQTVVPLGSR